MSAAGMAAVVGSACGLVLSFEAMMRGPFIVGYLGAATSGDVLIWGVLIMAALWLPRKTAPTS